MMNCLQKWRTPLLVILPLLALAPATVLASAPVIMNINGLNSTLDNGLVKFSFGSDGSAQGVWKDGTNLITHLSGAIRDPSKNRSFYLDYYSSGVNDFIPKRVEVIRQTPELAHIAYIDDSGGKLRLEYHLIMKKGISGLYSYVVASNPGQEAVNISELRNVYRFDASRMNQLFNSKHRGTPLLYSELEQLPKVQDETWRLADNSVYSKYDFAGYIRESPYWGVMGNGFGAWLVPASYEYYSGDALKQELLVHQDAIILNYMTGSHFGTPDLVAPPGWEKLYGPWLLYINQGSDTQLIADVNRQASHERASWPYRWVEDSRYPQQRSTLTGKLNMSVPKAMVVLTSSDEPFDIQTHGYFFSAKTKRDGLFSLHNVPAGKYHLSVYALGGQQIGILAQRSITVEKQQQNLGTIKVKRADRIIWSIGKADRRAGEFKWGDRPRHYQWQTQVPANLTFEIGKSKDSQDWYYAQTKPGSWIIQFNTHVDASPRVLNIAIAAASNNGMTTPTTTPQLAVKVNDQRLSTLRYSNDKAIYREAMQNGRYHEVHIPLPDGVLKKGVNRVTLELQGGMVMYDAISLSEPSEEE
ncbi:polysaccharide lyase family protein [Brenneria uluponensis]|uniref:polysaccharide lyase family protein n=1 Tax=Brenneria uluponensis TaxID=3057057 RepID=UPI0028E53E45|nr:polysaccharide lyase family protein [Brenneria ulupoensis]